MSILDLPVSRPLQLARPPIRVQTHGAGEITGSFARWSAYANRGEQVAPSRDPAWLRVIEMALGQTPYCLEALRGEATCGLLPLVSMRSRLFGRFLVGMPYLNTGGVLADDDAAERMLVDAAIELADRLDVRYLELRHERPVEHPALAHRMAEKVHMRLELPDTPGTLWDQLAAKVRNQVRKGQKSGLTVCWGGAELLGDFYAVFSENMRDLGTPVYGRSLFRAVLDQFPEQSELCVVRVGKRPAAGALLLHGKGVSDVPSASSLRFFNPLNVNMLMYWHLLERAIQRRQRIFDFGRSTRDSNTFRFKKQWGATPSPSEWQYYIRKGAVGEMRPDNPKYQRLIRVWQRLPVFLTRWVGPVIVRGIP